VALFVMLGLAACVTPKDDYDDFIARTADARAALSIVPEPMMDAGPREASLPDGGFEGTYFLSCLPTLSGGDVTKALNFQATLEVLPSADGGSTMTFSGIALKVGAADLSDTVGATNVGSGTIGAMGEGDVIIPAEIIIPGEANPIATGTAATIAPGADLKFYVTSATQLCAGLTATVTAPMMLKLAGNATPCILQEFPGPSGALPTLNACDYHCP
jgi:hypothetical protein